MLVILDTLLTIVLLTLQGALNTYSYTHYTLTSMGLGQFKQCSSVQFLQCKVSVVVTPIHFIWIQDYISVSKVLNDFLHIFVRSSPYTPTSESSKRPSNQTMHWPSQTSQSHKISNNMPCESSCCSKIRNVLLCFKRGIGKVRKVTLYAPTRPTQLISLFSFGFFWRVVP